MAKTRVKKPTKTEEPTPAAPPAEENPKLALLMDPKAMHELLGIHGPYDPVAPPIPTKGYLTWWDPGASVQTLVKKHRELFYLKDFSERYAKDSDSWKWRQFRLTPIEPDLTFEDQRKQLKTGDEPAAVRELVTYLLLRFLVTGERLDLGRLRTKDLAASGQRMTVWFSPMGFDLASVSDKWRSPGIGLLVMSTPIVKPKRK